MGMTARMSALPPAPSSLAPPARADLMLDKAGCGALNPGPGGSPKMGQSKSEIVIDRGSDGAGAVARRDGAADVLAIVRAAVGHRRRTTAVIRGPLFLSLGLLAGCGWISNPPCYERPDPKALMGTYRVVRVSWFAPARSALMSTQLSLSSDGTFRRSGGRESFMLPGEQGAWKIVETWGNDLGSRQTWGVRFSHPDGSWRTAFCVGAGPRYALLFFDDDHTPRQQSGHWLLRVRKVMSVGAGLA